MNTNTMTDDEESEEKNQEKRHDCIIESIKSDYETHKQDHERLRDELVAVIEENRELKKRLKDAGHKEILMSGKNVETQTIERLKVQIRNLSQEKESFEELWHTSQRTIATLETEVAHYRRQLNQPNTVHSLKQEYLKNLKEMEARMHEAAIKLDRKTKEMDGLNRGKIEAETKVSAMESKFNEIISQKTLIIEKCRQSEIALANARSQITYLSKEKTRLETELDKVNALVQEHKMRKTEAVAKVHEALTLAENALAEKDACQTREKDYKEECEYLARTIGQVMEDAAKKVDDEFETMRREHQTEVDRLMQTISKNKTCIDQQNKRLKDVMARCEDMEQKISALSKSNMILDSDLHRASQTIVDLELKTQTLEKGIKKEQEHSAECGEKTRQLQEIIDENRKMKVQWKQMTLDVTSKLQDKIKELYERVRRLQNENQRLQNLLDTEES